MKYLLLLIPLFIFTSCEAAHDCGYGTVVVVKPKQDSMEITYKRLKVELAFLDYARHGTKCLKTGDSVVCKKTDSLYSVWYTMKKEYDSLTVKPTTKRYKPH